MTKASESLSENQHSFPGDSYTPLQQQAHDYYQKQSEIHSRARSLILGQLVLYPEGASMGKLISEVREDGQSRGVRPWLFPTLLDLRDHGLVDIDYHNNRYVTLVSQEN